jgi:hypothetical protein
MPRSFHAVAARALFAAVALAAAVPAAMAQGSSNLRNEFAIHWAPGALANDDRRSRSLAYDRHFGEGWSLGASLGYGKVLSSDGGDGAYAVVRARKRFAELAAVPGLSPQLGLEYGGTTDVFDSVDLLGLFGGVHYALSTELGVTADLWLGRARFERTNLLQTTEGRRGTVRNVRFGLVIRY